ncbi:MAG: PepSY domain-containing protein [Myxococcota bacterium]
MVVPKRRLYLLHRWVGVILAAPALLVFFSGAIAVFHHELHDWAHRGQDYRLASEVSNFDLDRAHAIAAEGVPEKYLAQVDIHQPKQRPMRFFFHAHDQVGGTIEEHGVSVDLDPQTLETVRRRSGPRADAMAPTVLESLGTFFFDLHIQLLMPETLGLVATGIVGFALMLLVVTGTFVHRPNLAKLSRRPRTGKARRLAGEVHTFVGSWTLPFTAVLAMTGAFFSFAGAVLIPVVAMTAFDGDQEALIRAVIGQVEVADSTAVAELGPIFDDAHRRADGTFDFITLDQWNQPGANVTVGIVEHASLGDHTRTFVYDGHTGALIREKPIIGPVPSFGNTLFMLMADLHFGTLIGLVTKILWFVLGLATCALALVGLLVFVERRGDQKRTTRTVGILTGALGGGLPLATAGACLSWVIAGASGVTDVSMTMTVVFFIGLIQAGVFVAWLPLRRAIGLAWGLAGVAFLAFPFLAPLVTGLGPLAAWTQARASVAVDLGIVFVGLLLLSGAFSLRSVAAQTTHRAVESQVAV